MGFKPIRYFKPKRPDNMLAIIAPHPDDDVLCCSGVIHRNADNVMVIYVTDGRGFETF